MTNETNETRGERRAGDGYYVAVYDAAGRFGTLANARGDYAAAVRIPGRVQRAICLISAQSCAPLGVSFMSSKQKHLTMSEQTLVARAMKACGLSGGHLVGRPQHELDAVYATLALDNRYVLASKLADLVVDGTKRAGLAPPIAAKKQR